MPLLKKTHHAPFATYRYVLPFPPSVNHYWRTMNRGGRQITYVSKDGVKFAKAVDECVQHKPRTRRRLEASFYFQRHDNRDYDISNLLKSTEDALAKAGVYEDDSQIDVEHLHRLPPVPGEGKCLVIIQEIGYATTKVKVNRG